MPESNSQPNVVVSWLRLLRVANLPTAIANILMAYLLAHGSWSPVGPLCLLILASMSLYSAGMVLNDVFDCDKDSVERPERPIPAGLISLRSARIAGYSLLVIGVGFAVCAWFIAAPSGFETIVVAGLLAMCIYLYDGPFKKTMAAPFLMGACRGLNILLGASTLTSESVLQLGNNAVMGWPIWVWWIAISIAVLITGVTLLARNETKANSRAAIGLASAIIAAGIVGIASIVYCPGFESAGKIGELFPFLIALISVTIVRRLVQATATGLPKDIQSAVISVLRSLIIFDASICFVAVPGKIVYAIIVLALLIPALWLGKWSRVT